MLDGTVLIEFITKQGHEIVAVKPPNLGFKYYTWDGWDTYSYEDHLNRGYLGHFVKLEYASPEGMSVVVDSGIRGQGGGWYYLVFGLDVGHSRNPEILTYFNIDNSVPIEGKV